MKNAAKLLLLVLLIATLCVTLAACGEKDPPAPVCAHTYDNGVITTDSTCIAKGTRTYTCSKCGDTYTQDDVSMKEHTYSTEGVETTAPTCTVFGVMTYTCTTEGCSATTTAAIERIPHAPAETLASDETWHWNPCTMCGMKLNSAGHVYDETLTVTEIEATCILEGKDIKTCADCGAKVDFVTEKGDHVWDEGEVLSAASTTGCQSGRTKLTCTQAGCGATKTVATPGATAHTVAFEAVTVAGSKQLTFSCSVCEDAWTSSFAVNADGTNVLANDIDWNIKSGYASPPSPAMKDGAYEILLGSTATATAQAEFFFPSKKAGKLIKDFTAANSSVAMYTISVKAPAGGFFDQGFSVKMTNEEGTPRWTPAHAVHLLAVDNEGVITGNVDAEGNVVQLGTISATEWTDIAVAIELDGMNIYFTYTVNGVLRGTSVIKNTLHNMAATGTYFTGNTATPGTGVLIDNMTWSHSGGEGNFLPYARHLEHTWEKGETVAPSTQTCESGYTVYTCSVCGNSKHDDFVPSEIAHTWDEFNVKVNKAPVAADPENGVEAEDGEWTLTCTACGAQETVSGSFEDHVHGFDRNAGTDNTEGTETTYECIIPGCDETKVVAKEPEAAE